jgi:hypothetical protein
MTPAPQPNERRRQDRRKKPTSFWDAFRLRGRRLRNRRAEQHRQPYFVDRFSATMFGLVLALLLLTIVDGLITLNLMARDCQEINPLMRYFLGKGPVAFLLGKYVLTAAGVPVLLIFKNYYLFGTRFRVGYLLVLFVLLYLGLIAYQIQLLRSVAAG